MRIFDSTVRSLLAKVSTHVPNGNVPLTDISRMRGLLEHRFHQMQRPNTTIVWSVALEIAMNWVSVSVRP